MKHYNRHRKRVLACADWWTQYLGLRWWRFQWQGYDSRKAFRKATVSGPNVVMKIHADWRYLEATVSVNVPRVAELTDDELEAVVVHELCHALVHEMREADPDIRHEERVVTTLAKAFLWVRDAARAEATE